MSSTTSDLELKARHRAMWAAGDYPSMVETFLLPLQRRASQICGTTAGTTALWRRIASPGPNGGSRFKSGFPISRGDWI